MFFLKTLCPSGREKQFSPEQNGPDPPGDGRTRQPAMAGGEDDAAGGAKKAR